MNMKTIVLLAFLIATAMTPSVHGLTKIDKTAMTAMTAMDAKNAMDATGAKTAMPVINDGKQDMGGRRRAIDALRGKSGSPPPLPAALEKLVGGVEALHTKCAACPHRPGQPPTCYDFCMKQKLGNCHCVVESEYATGL